MPDITMPRLSDSMEEGTILKWLKADGDDVATGDELVEIETDKATMTYEADADGTLSIIAQEGETLAIGQVIAHLGDGEHARAGDGAAEAQPAAAQAGDGDRGGVPAAREAVPTAEAPAAAAPEPDRPPTPGPTHAGNGDRPKASPVA